MLTRESIRSGAYLRSFRDLPDQPCWSNAQIAASLKQTLSQRKNPRSPVWVFAYGSLIWNPLLKYEEQRSALLQGWHRSFCIRLLDGRATPDKPGRMLGLEQGGQTRGVAYKLSEYSLEDELMLTWIREMVHGVYMPIWGEVALDSGETVESIAFVMDDQHPLYISGDNLSQTASAILEAEGHLGTNRDYLQQLEQSLLRYNICDSYIESLLGAVKAHAA